MRSRNAPSRTVWGCAEVAEKFSVQGAEPDSNTPEQFASYIRSEIAEWSRVVQASGARAA